MNALTLHLLERRGLARWAVAALAILALHAAIVTAVVWWYARKPVRPDIVPAIAVTLAPVESSSPEIQNQDIAVGPTMQQAEAAPREPPKVEEKPVEQVVQPPPQTAEITLPQVEPKPVEKPKPEERPPAPETRAPQKTEHIGQFTQAGSDAYDALVLGHLERFKRYPSAAGGAQGRVAVRFVLNRAGAVIESAVTKSSGNNVLDREVLESLRRASPFPRFPAAKPDLQDTYFTTVNFAK